MSEVFETLKKKSDTSVEVYPNIKNQNIPNGAVTTDKIADDNVTTSKIADGSVTSAKINDGAVTGSKIADGSVGISKLADGSVSSSKILNSAVTTDKINTQAVTTTKIADGSVTSVKIADNNVNTNNINGKAVTTAKLDDGAVTYPKIADGSVSDVKIATKGVKSTNIDDKAVTWDKIHDEAVKTAKLDNKAVTTAKLDDEAVTNAKLGLGSVGYINLDTTLMYRLDMIMNTHQIVIGDNNDNYLVNFGTTTLAEDFYTYSQSEIADALDFDKAQADYTTTDLQILKYIIDGIHKNVLGSYSVTRIYNDYEFTIGIISSNYIIRMKHNGNTTFELQFNSSLSITSYINTGFVYINLISLINFAV